MNKAAEDIKKLSEQNKQMAARLKTAQEEIKSQTASVAYQKQMAGIQMQEFVQERDALRKEVEESNAKLSEAMAQLSKSNAELATALQTLDEVAEKERDQEKQHLMQAEVIHELRTEQEQLQKSLSAAKQAEAEAGSQIMWVKQDECFFSRAHQDREKKASFANLRVVVGLVKTVICLETNANPAGKWLYSDSTERWRGWMHMKYSRHQEGQEGQEETDRETAAA